ncbi:unnamed protein product [Brassica rapa subsp. trilocularis]
MEVRCVATGICRLWPLLSSFVESPSLLSIPLPGFVASAPFEAYRFVSAEVALFSHRFVQFGSVFHRFRRLTIIGYLSSVLEGGIGWSGWSIHVVRGFDRLFSGSLW